MKTLSILLLLFTATITATAQTSCEDKWNEVKRINTSDTWKERNTTSSGKVMWKTIEYNNDYAYKLYRVVSTGYYYVQDYGFDKMVYYSNEKDAIRALFIWSKCGTFTEQGRVKN